jgi:ribonuclease VapC
MVIDASALVALLQDEPEADEFRMAIHGHSIRLVSAATVVEASIVLEGRFGEIAGRELDLFLSKVAIEVVPVDAEQIAEARRAWRRFGRGRHAAALNFGDLFAYALSRTTGEPLLFKGDDFARTDVARVL